MHHGLAIITIIFALFNNSTCIEQKQNKQSDTQSKTGSSVILIQDTSSFFCRNGFHKDIFPKLNRGAHLQRNRKLLVETVYSFSMYVDQLDQTVSRSIANTGTWEPGFINVIGHLVKPGQTVLNLGSQTGLQAIVISKIVGKNGRLFIFQPYSVSYQLISQSIQFNKEDDITTIYQLGASNEESTAVIQISYSNTGASQIFHSGHSKSVGSLRGGLLINEKEEIKLTTVDSILPSNKMEVKALIGMKDIISRSPNLIIVCQWQYKSNPNANQEQAMHILLFMKELGYKIFHYNGSLSNVKEQCQLGNFIEYTKIETLLNIHMTDIYFFPKGYDPPA